MEDAASQKHSLSAAVASKADAATVAASLTLKADKANPTFTGEATAANLTANGNISVTQTGTSLTVKKIQAAPTSNLNCLASSAPAAL